VHGEDVFYILENLALLGQGFSIMCIDIVLELRHSHDSSDLLRRILPRWLYSYTSYLHIDLEDAGFLLAGYVIYLLWSLFHIIMSRPVLRQILFAVLFLWTYRKIFG